MRGQRAKVFPCEHENLPPSTQCDPAECCPGRISGSTNCPASLRFFDDTREHLPRQRDRPVSFVKKQVNWRGAGQSISWLALFRQVSDRVAKKFQSRADRDEPTDWWIAGQSPHFGAHLRQNSGLHRSAVDQPVILHQISPRHQIRRPVSGKLSELARRYQAPSRHLLQPAWYGEHREGFDRNRPA